MKEKIQWKHAGRCLLGVFVLCVVSAQSLAQTAAQPRIIPRAPDIAATSYILMDAKTGKVLVEGNADEPQAPASLTKIMTTYVAESELAAGNINLDDEVFVSVKAWRTEGSKMFIQEGTKVRLEDILRGIIIQSGNDASVALAEHIAGSEDAFADMMNQYARQLGLEHSHFTNSHGLPDPEHTMSARDLAIVAREVITRFPEQYKIYGEKEFTYNDIRQPNRNTLLFQDPDVDGMKTGFTDNAGYCLVASALRDDMRLIAVVMGTASEAARAIEAQKLLSYGFRFFETHQLFTANQILATNQVWYGRTNAVDIGIQDEVFVTIPRREAANLKTELNIGEALKAPLAVGQVLGQVSVSLDDEVFYEGPVVAMQAVDRGNFIKRLMDFLHLFFLGLFG
ncbi:MAG: D-alanyl-D-alanine carboxypeptidase family protein [Pseudomonadales bacterium]|nr:D-alanyl-D-alanine carboxypeptidase family protein [Pseudomonadales bacterium]